MQRVPTCHPQRKHQAHGLCQSCYKHEWNRKKRAADPEYDKAYRKHKTVLHLNQVRHSKGGQLPWVKGNTRAQVREFYETVWLRQKGMCAICGKEESVRRALCLDHDHETGKLRGLLCLHCNSGLGQFKDNKVLLAKAHEYLEEA